MVLFIIQDINVIIWPNIKKCLVQLSVHVSLQTPDLEA
jgi:hypothetical protein